VIKTCKIENCNNPVWSKSLCKNHINRKPLPSGRGLTNKKLSFSKTKSKKEINSEQMHLFFIECWKKRPHYSEISGKFLGNEPMSTYFHHILPKNKYPQIALDEENIVFLTLDEHTNVESDMYKYEEINKRRELLKTKYGIL